MKKIIAPIIALLCFLIVWEKAVHFFHISAIILPTPSSIGQALIDHFPLLITHAGLTVMASILGFILGGVIAYLLAVLFVTFPILKDALYPYTVVLKLTPLIVMVPLIILWCGEGIISKIVIAAIASFLPILVNAIKGLENIPHAHLLLMRSLVANSFQVLVKLRMPASMGYTFAGMRIASAMSLLGAIIMELIGSTHGIGFIIGQASYALETPLLFAAIFLVAIIGVLFFISIEWLSRKLVFWETS